MKCLNCGRPTSAIVTMMQNHDITSTALGVIFVKGHGRDELPLLGNFEFRACDWCGREFVADLDFKADATVARVKNFDTPLADGTIQLVCMDQTWRQLVEDALAHPERVGARVIYIDMFEKRTRVRSLP